MAVPDPVVISGAVEGDLDEEVLVRLVEYVGARLGPVYGKRGKPHLLHRLSGYDRAARHSPWVVLVDLDSDAECAPPFRSRWLANPSAPNMVFRVAVRAIEAWLLADPERLANFLGVSTSRVPQDPDALGDPKETLVNLARRSRRREIREDIVPRPGSGRNVGPAYTSRLIEFVADASHGWRPNVAASLSDSLSRCLRALHALASLQRGLVP